MHGLQLWAALPRAFEEADPGFSHTPAAAIPAWSQPGVAIRVLIGDAFGRRSPVATFAPTLYLDVALQPGATLDAAGRDADVRARRLQRRPAAASSTAPTFRRSRWRYWRRASERRSARRKARATSSIGGAPLDGPRFIWWNFVSSSKERIEQAKEDWTAQRMGRIPGEHEWIPLP